MLFDLQGKRRRLVQATYLTLAVLMGGGLVLFGIGGDVSGGLFDAFSDRTGGSGNDVVEERVDNNEERVQSDPKALAARKELVRDYYSLAASQVGTDGVFPADAQDELRSASTHWVAYLRHEKGKPDPSLARVALRVYDTTALNRPQEAVKAARIVAEDGNDPGTYLQLAQYSMLAGDKRTEKLASGKAIDLAEGKRQRKAVRKQLQDIRAAIIAQQLQESGDLQIDPNAGGGQQGGKSGGAGQQQPNRQGAQ